MKSYEDVAMVPYDERRAVYQSLAGTWDNSKVDFILRSYELYGPHFPEISGYKRKIDKIKTILNPSEDRMQVDDPTLHRAEAFGEGATLALGLRFFVSDLEIPFYNEPADYLLWERFQGSDEVRSAMKFINTGFTASSQTDRLRDIIDQYISQRDELIDRPSASTEAMMLAGAGCIGLMIECAEQAEDTSLSLQNADMFDDVTNAERRYTIDFLQDLYDES